MDLYNKSQNKIFSNRDLSIKNDQVIQNNQVIYSNQNNIHNESL